MEENFGYIYLTTNLINGKIYVGQHIATEFNPNYKGSGLRFLRAMKKYGEDKFETKILEWCFSKEELDAKEDVWILKYEALDPKKGYNLKRGGSHGKHSLESIKKMSENAKKAKREPWNKGKTGVYSEEVRESISNSLHLYASGEKPKSRHPKVKNGEIISEEEYKKGFMVFGEKSKPKPKVLPSKNTKRSYSYGKRPTTRKERQEIYENTDHTKTPFFGKHHSEETKRKISESEKGKKLSEETKKKISLTSIENAKNNPNYGMRGKHHSEETRKKISEYQTLHNCNRGKSPSEETRKKISEANKGRKMNEEFRENCRKRMVGKKHSQETIEKIRQKNMGRIITEEAKEKLRQNKIGTKMIHKEGIQKFVKTEEIEKWLNDGWELGKASKLKEGVK